MSAIITLAVASVWWLTLAPKEIGGPLTYAIVSGESMEPALQDGDLFVARSQQDYEVGDTIVYKIFGGYVVHEILALKASSYKTRGINNPYPDSWIVPEKNVLGKQVAVIPSMGSSLVFFRANPLALGFAAATLATLLLVDFRPRTKSKRLLRLLTQAKREIPDRSWPVASWLADGLLFLTATSFIATSLLLARGVDFYPRVALSLLATVLVTIGFEILSSWINNGKSLNEPYRSIKTFGSRLFILDSDVEIEGESQLVGSSKKLLTLAEAARSPLIHMARRNGKLHEFWLVTDDTNYFWRVEV